MGIRKKFHQAGVRIILMTLSATATHFSTPGTKLPIPIYNLITLLRRVPEPLQLILLDVSAKELSRQCQEHNMKEAAITRGIVRAFYRKAKTFCDWNKFNSPYGDLEPIVTAWKRSQGLLKSWGEL